MKWTVVILLLIVGCRCDHPTTVSVNDLECPAGTFPIVERSGGVGECGWAFSCKDSDGVRNGRFIAVMSNVKSVEGTLRAGKNDGEWTAYHKDGRVYQKIIYADGSELSRSVINQ